VFKTSYGQDLKLGLIERLGKPLRPDQLIVAEVYGGRIAQIIGTEATASLTRAVCEALSLGLLVLTWLCLQTPTEDSTPVEVLKDKDVVVVYEVPAAHLSAQARRRMSFPFDKTSSPVVGAKSDLPLFVISRYNKYASSTPHVRPPHTLTLHAPVIAITL
jgi:hypothetical protein